MINSFDQYFKIDRNKIPLKNQKISFNLWCFLCDRYRIKLKDPELWRVIKDPEFRESLKVEIPKELYDINTSEGDKLYPMSSIFQYPNQEEFILKNQKVAS